jgi:hypothetical protein
MRGHGFQPRDPRATRAVDVAKEEDALEKHIGRMQAILAADPLAQLDPVLVAVIEGRRFVVDGHHRLAAYRRAGRFTIPTRERSMTAEHAALLSRLVNLDGVKLPLTSGQCAESAWQFVAAVTGRGRLPLKVAGLSSRTVAARFGNISHGTVDNMVSRLRPTKEAVDAGNQFSTATLDPITGWPKWRYARGSAAMPFDDADSEIKEAAKVGKCVAGLARLLDKFGAEVYQKAAQVLWAEALEVDPDAVRLRE